MVGWLVGWVVGWVGGCCPRCRCRSCTSLRWFHPLFCRPAGWPLPSQQWRELPRGSVVDGWQHGANTENGKTVEVCWVGSSPKYRQDMVIHGDATFNNECYPFWVAFWWVESWWIRWTGRFLGGDLQGSACQKRQPLTDKYHDVGG